MVGFNSKLQSKPKKRKSPVKSVQIVDGEEFSQKVLFQREDSYKGKTFEISISGGFLENENNHQKTTHYKHFEYQTANFNHKKKILQL